MTDRRPGPVKPVIQYLDRLNEIVPAGLFHRADKPIDFGTVFRDQYINRRLDVIRPDFTKTGKVCIA